MTRPGGTCELRGCFIVQENESVPSCTPNSPKYVGAYSPDVSMILGGQGVHAVLRRTKIGGKREEVLLLATARTPKIILVLASVDLSRSVVSRHCSSIVPQLCFEH